jgi:squalene-hopene/tetraprenyl-beta-curcumene cyclase
MNLNQVKALFLIPILLITSCSSIPGRSISSISDQTTEIKSIIRNLKAEILSQKKEFNGEEYYDMTAYLGTIYTSMYFLSLMWTGDFSSNKNYQTLALKYKKLLLSTQMNNGGWYRTLDVNLKDPSDISTTVMNYWFLKAMGENVNSAPMIEASNYILSHGSLKKIDLLTKVFLSLFQNYEWNEIPRIPYLLFNKYSPVNDEQLAAWLSPHILPLAILRKTKASKALGPKFSLKEFMNYNQSPIQSTEKKRSKVDEKMIQKLLALQEPKGSFGGYIIASIFSRMIISHPANKNFQKPLVRTQTFLDKYFFSSGPSNFLGATQDGHIWDSALLTGALIEAGTPQSETKKSLDHVIKQQTPHGGFPFGYDFENAPDVDDTAIVLSTSSHQYAANEPFILRSLNYLHKMQNDDGGFAAFTKNNKGNFILKFFTEPFKDTTDIFDESSPDVTGHVLEAYGRLGLTVADSRSVSKAIGYLRKSQNDNGAFFGRWGINYLYGTSAVLVGLSEVGMTSEDPMVKNAVNWLLSKQNQDGGFGESTLSYSKKEWEGVGVSTPSQTAWAIMGLLKYLPANHPTIQDAVQFLISNFKKNGTFIDRSVTGTGHPNAAYIVYPAYAKAFPLMAFARYLDKMKELP